MSIGLKLKALRESKKVSKLRLARDSGLNRTTIYRIEVEKKNPTAKTVGLILRALDASWSDLQAVDEATQPASNPVPT